MAQANLLGLCTDHVVTIVTPSSTIETPLFSDNPVNGSGTLTFGTPLTLPVPSTALYIVFGSVALPSGPVTATISIGSFVWSQTVTAAMQVPFQTICRGPPTLLITGPTGTTTYTFTATLLR